MKDNITLCGLIITLISSVTIFFHLLTDNPDNLLLWSGLSVFGIGIVWVILLQTFLKIKMK